MKSSKKIVFFVASFSSIEATAPLGILAISTPLIDAGYDIRIVDASITPDYKKRIMEEVKDALCLGISLVTGPMIRETVDLAKSIKKWDPDFPVILGGWHPSLLPSADARGGIRRHHSSRPGRGEHARSGGAIA